MHVASTALGSCHYGAIFGTATVALTGGGAAGPWVAGVHSRCHWQLPSRLPAGDRGLCRVGDGRMDRSAAPGAAGARPQGDRYLGKRRCVPCRLPAIWAMGRGVQRPEPLLPGDGAAQHRTSKDRSSARLECRVAQFPTWRRGIFAHRARASWRRRFALPWRNNCVRAAGTVGQLRRFGRRAQPRAGSARPTPTLGTGMSCGRLARSRCRRARGI